MRRIAESVFNDTPENEGELRDYTATLFFMCATVRGNLRGLPDEIQYSETLMEGVLKSIQDSVSELLLALDMFPRERIRRILEWIYENVFIATLGWVEIIPQEEVEEEIDASKVD
jgi:hypothetical protein